MAIYDNNPDRRNLVLLSISITVFVLAGGEVSDDNIRLQIVNVHFTNPVVLKHLVWILLAWFTYRYWLNNKGSWVNGYNKEIEQPLVQKLCYSHICKHFKLTDDYTMSIYPSSSKHSVSIKAISNGFIFEHHYRESQKNTWPGKYDRKTTMELRDYPILILCILVVFVKEPSLSTYFVPYAWVLFAVVLGVYKYILLDIITLLVGVYPNIIGVIISFLEQVNQVSLTI